MAVVTIYPNGISSQSGWLTGAYTDVDEGTDSPNDSDLMSTDSDGENEWVIFDMTSPGLTDSDTVTQVDVTVRGNVDVNAETNAFNVNIAPGGTAQTATNTSAITASPANYTVNHSSWNSDWTQSQLDGMQVRIQATQAGKAVARRWDLTAFQMDITYTPAASGGSHKLTLLGVG